ncbi:hypothetical protein IT415_01410 [bacterium]|nr:hypothetical protein [bacterium]
MLFLRRFFLALIGLIFPLILIGHTITYLLNSGVSTNALLKQSGAYSIAAEQMRSVIIGSQRIPEQYQTIFNKSVNDAITDQSVESVIQPALVDIVIWMQQPQDTPAPDVILIIKPIKDSLLVALQANELPAPELNFFSTTLTQQVPDQIKLSGLQQLTGAQGAQTTTTSAEGSPESFQTTVQSIKNTYTLIQNSLVALTILALCLIAGYALSARASRVNMMMAPALLLAIESALLFTLAIALPMLAKSSGAITLTDLPLRIAGQIATQVTFPSAVTWVIATIIYVLSLLLWRRNTVRRQGGPIIKTNLPRR